MRCYLLSEQLPSSGGQAGRDGWALHDSLFIPPNALAPCKISLPINDFITRDDFITLAPVCPSIANEPSPGSEGRLWPWSIQTNLNKSVIFVSVEAHLAASPSHPPSPVPLFYLLLTTLNTFYSHAHLFWRNPAAATPCLSVLAGVGSALVEWAGLFLVDRNHHTNPTPRSSCPPLWLILAKPHPKISQDSETLYFLIFNNNCRLSIFNFYTSFWLMDFSSASPIGIFSKQFLSQKVTLWKSLDIPTQICSNNQGAKSIHSLTVC